MESSSLNHSLPDLTAKRSKTPESGPASRQYPADTVLLDTPKYEISHLTAASISRAVSTLHVAGQLKQAAVVLRDFLRREPHYQGLQLRHANLLKSLGAYTDARVIYEKLRDMSATVPVDLKLSIAECFHNENDCTNALATLDEACLKTRKGLTIASEALRLLGRAVEAESYCVGLRSRGGRLTDQETLEYGLVLFEEHKDEEALFYLRGFDLLEPLSQLLCSLGRHEEHVKTYSFASVGQNPRLARWLAISHAALKHWPDAELLARVGLDVNPEDQGLLGLLGYVLAKQNVQDDGAEARMRAHLVRAGTGEELTAYLVALASRTGASPPSWHFLLAYADYHGVRKMLPLYREYFSDYHDAGFQLHMGERLIDWSVFKPGAARPSLDTMRDIVEGAALLKEATGKAFYGDRSEVRRARLEGLLETLDKYESMLEQFRTLTTPVPDDADCVEHMIAGARISAYYGDFSTRRAYLDAARTLGANAALLVELGMLDAAHRVHHPDEQRALDVGQALIGAHLPIEAGIISSIYARVWGNSVDLQAMAARSYFDAGDYIQAQKYFQALRDLQDLSFSIEDCGKLAECYVATGRYQDAHDTVASYPVVVDRRALWMDFIALSELGKGADAEQPTEPNGQLPAKEHKRIADLLRAHGHVKQADWENVDIPEVCDILEVSASAMLPVAHTWPAIIERLATEVKSDAAIRCYVQKCIPYLQPIPTLETFVLEYVQRLITKPSYQKSDSNIAVINAKERNSRLVEVALSVAPPTLALLKAAVWHTNDGAKYARMIADRHGDFEPLLEWHWTDMSGGKEYLESLREAAHRYPDRYGAALKKESKKQERAYKEERKQRQKAEKAARKAELKQLQNSACPPNITKLRAAYEHAVGCRYTEQHLAFTSSHYA
ncbi:hypothetical protein BDV26DRAFT_288927 [Aspergillus bertholletiae]|uniref:Uncharacterized protein n=1 Tax=Aspergillus bertholletiae TaxID=1226010 RepID=A0A5N7BJG7_9EURO|nr:hypothetical protein BDV26DRAFT_288927 [Aspergillus bertholletiae]